MPRRIRLSTADVGWLLSIVSWASSHSIVGSFLLGCHKNWIGLYWCDKIKIAPLENYLENYMPNQSKIAMQT